MRNGKYRKLYLPYLKRNYNEEIERYSSSMDFDSKRLIFGSQEGSLLLWKPSSDKKKNYCKKYKISDQNIDFLHIHENYLSLIENGFMRIYSIDDVNDMHLEHSFDLGR